MRILISLNWLLGTVFLFAAVFYGFIDKTISRADTAVIEQTVANIVKAQTGEYATGNRYVTFRGTDYVRGFNELGLSAPTDDNVIYEAVDGGDGVLQIVARVRPIAVSKESMKPLVYTATMRNGASDSAEWLPLSNTERGLGLF